ncbi:PQQ-binding-like beta-propeller repeat protein [Candidatus Gracilibacteria bacterium]|nr:PQQ-binding-like beta-propeller repeat protein [Candidatus Gracilibacteria bacterium]
MKRAFSTAMLALASCSALVLATGPATAYEVPQNEQLPGFPKVITNTTYAQFGSPTLADIDGDGRPDIVVGSKGGIVFAVRHNGELLWQRNIGNDIIAAAQAVNPSAPTGVAPPVRSAPAVADMNGDGNVEIVISIGDILGRGHGGVIVLNKDGQPLPGWPQLPIDRSGSSDTSGPDGYADTVISSPAIGDVTGDGVPEIVYGANDQFIYVKALDGADLPGWPRFIYDTVWSSPAIADVDDDGVNELIIGVDAHNYTDPTYNPPIVTRDGGDLYALNGDGTLLWRASQDEIFQSSPALADIDNDGKLEVVAGTGSYYSNLGRGTGKYLSAWNAEDGSLLWRTTLPAIVTASPAIGDLNGDNQLDIAVGGRDGVMRSFNGKTGAIQWATKGADLFNKTPEQWTGTPVLGDYDGDGRDDVFAAMFWDVLIFKGSDGTLLTGHDVQPPANDPKPSFYARWTLNNVPALGDLDGNGKLDLVAVTGDTSAGGENAIRFNVWPLQFSSLKASWPMFRGSPDHKGIYQVPQVRLSGDRLNVITDASRDISYSYEIDVIGGSGSWTATKSDPSGFIELNKTAGSSGEELIITLRLNTVLEALNPGNYSGSVTINSPGLPSQRIDVNAKVLNSVNEVFVPLVTRGPSASLLTSTPDLEGCWSKRQRCPHPNPAPKAGAGRRSASGRGFAPAPLVGAGAGDESLLTRSVLGSAISRRSFWGRSLPMSQCSLVSSARWPQSSPITAYCRHCRGSPGKTRTSPSSSANCIVSGISTHRLRAICSIACAPGWPGGSSGARSPLSTPPTPASCASSIASPPTSTTCIHQIADLTTARSDFVSCLIFGISTSGVLNPHTHDRPDLALVVRLAHRLQYVIARFCTRARCAGCGGAPAVSFRRRRARASVGERRRCAHSCPAAVTAALGCAADRVRTRRAVQQKQRELPYRFHDARGRSAATGLGGAGEFNGRSVDAE